jgi:carboxypeptidase Taq
MDGQSAYEELVQRSREQTLLTSCMELLGWDELTHMPRGGVENRSQQMAYLSGLYHSVSTDPRFGELLNIVEASPLVAEHQASVAINVREWRRWFDRRSRVPRALVQELATVTTTAQQAWAAARQDSDYELFRPWLEKIVRLKQNEAACVGHAGVAYDALLEDYEPGARSADLTVMFHSLRGELAKLLDHIQGASRRSRPSILNREYPIDRQKVFVEAVLSDLGFDFEHGRLDATTHPFYSPLGPGDCRITTRYNQYDFGDAFFSVLHEFGHGLYEQGLDSQSYGTPLGESMMMSMHESQSRLWEKFIGLSRPFWEHFFPRARDVFHDALHDVSLDEFCFAVNEVDPGWNRVRADAVTYDLHILARFELEQGLIAGDLQPADLPAAWDEKYVAYLGIKPENDAEGCLQDGHWSAGQFGYFPTYTLGNICAAQLFRQVQRDLPDLNELMTRGDFSSLLTWLHDSIYQHGQRYTTAELMQRITGQQPHHAPLVETLRATHGELHGI